MKIEILKIESISFWKFWKIDNHYVTANIDGTLRKVSIFITNCCSPFLVLHYVKNKHLKREQFDGRDWIEDWNMLYEQLKERDLLNVVNEELLNEEFELPEESKASVGKEEH